MRTDSRAAGARAPADEGSKIWEKDKPVDALSGANKKPGKASHGRIAMLTIS